MLDEKITLRCALHIARMGPHQWAMGIQAGKVTAPGKIEAVGIASLWVDDEAVNTRRKAVLHAAEVILNDLVRDESVVVLSCSHPIIQCPKLCNRLAKMANARNMVIITAYKEHLDKYVTHIDMLACDAIRRKTSITERLDDPGRCLRIDEIEAEIERNPAVS